MNVLGHHGNYAEGWTNGNLNLILSSISIGYIFDDLNVGKLSKETRC